MDQLGCGILSVVTAALVVGILCSFCDTKTGTGTLIRMVCGLVLLIHILSGLLKADFDILMSFSDLLLQSTEDAVSQGSRISSKAASEIIKEKTEAYILDKAAAYGVCPEVEVFVSTADVPIPESVRIRGSVSPYARKQLERIVEDELGIPKENQEWIG